MKEEQKHTLDKIAFKTKRAEERIKFIHDITQLKSIKL